MAIIRVTSGEFRKKQAFFFDLADKGEQIIIERRGKISYMLTRVDDSVHNEPNEETKAAIEEARAGKFAGTIDTSSMETFIKSFE